MDDSKILLKKILKSLQNIEFMVEEIKNNKNE